MQVPKEKIPKEVPVQAIRKIEKERNGTIATANELQVKNQDDSDQANLILRKLTAAVKMVESRFKEIMAPQNEALRQIKALKDEILQPLKSAKTELTNRLMSWRDAERRRIAEEQAKAEAKRRERERLEERHAENGRQVPGPEPVIEEPAPLEATDTTKVRVNWDIEIPDYWKLPKRYIVINEPGTRANIRRDVSAAEKGEDGEPQIEIAGVNIVRNETPIFA